MEVCRETENPMNEEAVSVSIDWSRHTPQEVFDALRAAPHVGGPWTADGPDDNSHERYRVAAERVRRLVWVGYESLPDWRFSIPGGSLYRSGFSTHRAAMAAADAVLRDHGWLLVDADDDPREIQQCRFRRERMRVRALARAYHRMASEGRQLDIRRASGACVCPDPACGFSYAEHPDFDPACPTLVVLCDGTHVKL